MGIDLDITPGKWELSGDYSYVWGLGPFIVEDGNEHISVDKKDNVVATLCVPQFKDVADVADEISELIISKGVTSVLNCLEHRPAICLLLGQLAGSTSNLKDRIKELKGD